MKKEREPKRFSEVLRKSGPYLNLGMGLAVPTALGAISGHWLDGKWGTDPWATLVGSLLGMAVGFYHFLKVVLRKL